MRGALSREQRGKHLADLASTKLDVLVVGGGVVGAGAALDAAGRGLKVGLVEASDWASGTSSRSSKLLHGGLRYLEMLDFGLVREALRERDLILGRLAPHLARPIRFIYPLTHHGWERWYVGAGLVAYDLMAARVPGNRGVPGHRHLGRQAVLQAAPGLRADALVGGVEYSDAQVDDARFTLGLVRTAAHHGALVVSRAKAVDFLLDGERVVGARVRDTEGGREIDVRAEQVVSATGVWTDQLRAFLGEPETPWVRASKGVHVLVPRARIHSSGALLLRAGSSVVLAVPWGRHWMLGTTDTDWDLDMGEVVASKRDIDQILDHINPVLADPLTADDVVGVYAGLRPLLQSDVESSTQTSREHAVRQPAPGLTVVAGGKLTTYRVMAKDAIDAAAADMSGAVPESVSERLPLVGAEGFAAAWNRRGLTAASAGLDSGRMERLLRRYGTMADDLVASIAAHPALGAPLDGAKEYLAAEVFYAVTHEGALHVDDVLDRRTHIAIETSDRGVRAAAAVAGLMGPLLGWSPDQTEAEVRLHHERIVRERAAEQAPDDEHAVVALAGSGIG